jgi:hypothetical protein
MSAPPASEHPADPRKQLPIAVYRSIVADLYNCIPPPTLADPELIAERVHAAIAEIACMCPVNAEEGQIAARVAIADAQSRECIRHARTLFNDPIPAMKCQAQANSHMRTANAARSLLLRVQAARHKREAVQATCDQDAWTIHATEGFLLEADGQHVPAPPPPPKPQPEAAARQAAGDDDKFARYDEAEQYAALYPGRTAEIRAYGGVPPTARYGPPDESLVAALLASTSPMLREIDTEYTPRPPFTSPRIGASAS